MPQLCTLNLILGSCVLFSHISDSCSYEEYILSSSLLVSLLLRLFQPVLTPMLEYAVYPFSTGWTRS